jgi:hypothetical protein
MGIPVVWPDVEAAVITYLTTALAGRAESFTDGVDVVRTLPDPRPARCVTVRSDGGPSLGDVRGLARLGVNVWAQTDEDAADLANLTSALVTAMPNGQPVITATASLPYAIPDPSGQPLRYFTAELVVRGTGL